MKNLYKDLRFMKAMAAGAGALAQQEDREYGEKMDLLADLAEAIESGIESIMVSVAEKIED